jgi:hypothetical protein
MKIRFGKTTIITLATLLAVGLAAVRLLPKSKVHAQSTCSVATLSGAYAYANSGFYGGANGALSVFAVAGVITADGNGGFTSVDTSSQNGVITRNRALSGTYQVGPSCSGSLALISGGQTVGNIDFVLLNNGQSAKFIQTDSGTAISGVAEKQNPYGS